MNTNKIKITLLAAASVLLFTESWVFTASFSAKSWADGFLETWPIPFAAFVAGLCLSLLTRKVARLFSIIILLGVLVCVAGLGWTLIEKAPLHVSGYFFGFILRILMETVLVGELLVLLPKGRAKFKPK